MGSSLISQKRSSSDEKIIKSFKEDFAKVVEVGWIKSRRSHNTGIGKTFEDLIGVVENNNLLVDYKGTIELKSQRIYSESYVSLFTRVPTYPKKSMKLFREDFGYPDEQFPLKKVLNSTITAKEYRTVDKKFALKLDVNRQDQRLYIKIKKVDDDSYESPKVFLSFEDIQARFEKKCRIIAYIEAETKREENSEWFKFEKAVLLSGLTFDDFLMEIEKGNIFYDIRLGIYKSGKKIGKDHDHGPAFRIIKKKIPKIFDYELL